MAYQLWVSQTTGYRRTGTSVVELRGLFERGITTEAIFEQLKCCLATDSGQVVSDKMKRLGFDVIGVKDDPNSPVLLKVRRSELGDALPCRQFATPIDATEIVASSTPLIDLLAVLKARDYAFVIKGSVIQGIVTRADLQKPPVRILLFGLISLLEIHLSYWISVHFPDDTWREHLSVNRIEKAKQLWEARQRRNEEIALSDCLQFCDKRTLVLASKEIRSELGFPSKNAAEPVLKTAEKIRDKLAHSQFDLETGDSWPVIIGVMESIEKALLSSEAHLEERVRGPAA